LKPNNKVPATPPAPLVNPPIEIACHTIKIQLICPKFNLVV